MKNRTENRTLPLLGRTALLLIVLAMLLSALAGCMVFMPEEVPEVSGKQVEFHFIDVGQGDAELIVTPWGNMLVDAGPGSSKSVLKSYLKAYGIKSFEYVIFTHPHEDHIGGGVTVLENFEVKNVIMPDAVSTTSAYKSLISKLESLEVNVIEGKAGETFSLGELAIEILSPGDKKYSDNTNNASIVFKATYGEISAMFTGDAEKEVEQDIMSAYGEKHLDVDLLKVGHHGSYTSSSEAWLRALSPSISVISCSMGNSYGHPHAQTMRALEAIGTEIKRTDTSGAIVLITDGATLAELE